MLDFRSLISSRSLGSSSSGEGESPLLLDFGSGSLEHCNGLVGAMDVCESCASSSLAGISKLGAGRTVIRSVIVGGLLMTRRCVRFAPFFMRDAYSGTLITLRGDEFNSTSSSSRHCSYATSSGITVRLLLKSFIKALRLFTFPGKGPQTRDGD